MSRRIPFIYITNKPLLRAFSWAGEKLSKIFLNAQYDLKKANISLEPKEYFSLATLNSFFYFTLFFFLIFIILFRIKNNEFSISLLKSLSFSFLIFLLFFIVLARYPKVLAGKRAEQEEKHLIFALKDMMLQINSGVSLFNSMANIANAGYGEISRDFDKAVKSINSGTAVEKALQKIAVESSSDFVKKTVWQLVNTIKVGASLRGALEGIIDELTVEQRNKIMGYSRELNMWVLSYMLFAVAVPTIGATLLIILSGFSGYSISKGLFVVFIIANFIIQFILIGFVKYRRPIVHL